MVISSLISRHIEITAILRKLFKILNAKKYMFNTVNSGHTVFQGKRKLLVNPVNGKKYIQYSEKFQGKLCFSGQRKLLKNIER